MSLGPQFGAGPPGHPAQGRIVAAPIEQKCKTTNYRYIYINITRYLRALKELRIMRPELSILLRNTPSDSLVPELALLEHLYQYRIVSDGRIEVTFVGSVAKKILGLVEGAVLGPEGFDCIHPDDRQEYYEKMSESNRTGAPMEFLFRSGQQYLGSKKIKVVSVPKYLPDGAIVRTGIVEPQQDGSGRETDAYVALERELATLEQRNKALMEENTLLARAQENYNKLIDALPQGVFVKKGSRFIYANQKYCNLFGVKDFDALKESTWQEIQPTTHHVESIAAHDIAVMESGIPKWIYGFEFTDNDGGQHFFDIVKSPFYIPELGESAILGIMVETTEKKIADLERTKFINDILERNKNLEQFSYIVSHNLRSSVANILGISDYLGHSLADNESVGDETHRLVSGLDLSAQKLDGVIKDLNDVVNSNQKFAYEHVNFHNILKEVKFELKTAIRESNTEIRYDFNGVAGCSSIRAYIHSIFFNLISNSIKYRKRNIPCVVEVCSRSILGGYELVFQDNGIGIDLEKHRQNVFGMYRTFHPGIPGKGMGLFMVKSQVGILDGTIGVESRPDIGTKFILQFKQ